MTSPLYMKLWIADYMLDTLHLNGAQHGYYLLLLMWMFRAGGRLPADDAKLAELAKCSPEEWAAARGVILPFFRRRGSVLTHKRVDVELSQYRSNIDGSRKAGIASAAKRANKSNGIAPTPVQPPVQPTEHSRTEQNKEVPPIPPGGQGELLSDNDNGVAYSAAFEDFWTAYPRKVAKLNAWRAWEKALKAGHHAASILEGLRAHVFNPDAKFIPHPSTWLNGGRWLDANRPKPKPADWL